MINWWETCDELLRNFAENKNEKEKEKHVKKRVKKGAWKYRVARDKMLSGGIKWISRVKSCSTKCLY